ncbi:MAG: DNA translocase FtsK [Chloroflexi bacterium]|nr:DNA translocase FtsK [Chloroflexota bacterium]
MRKRKKSTKPKRSGPLFRLNLRFSREILGLVLLFSGGLSLLALLFPEGILGSQWSNLLHAGFGWGAYLLPFLLGVLGLGYVWSNLKQGYRLRWGEASGWLLLYGTCLALLQLLAGNPEPGPTVTKGGGHTGYWIYHLLNLVIGSVGAITILFVLAILGLVLSFKPAPPDLLVRLSSFRNSVNSWFKVLLSARVRINRLLAYRPGLKLAWPSSRRSSRLEQLPLPEPKETPVLNIPSSPITHPAPPPPVEVLEPQVTEPAVISDKGKWQLPPITLLEEASAADQGRADNRQRAKLIEETLADFGVNARVVDANPGPAVTRFNIEPGFRERRDRTGAIVKREKIRVSEIISLANDLALALAAPTIRIEAPVPGKTVVGLEVPNVSTTLVNLRSVIESAAFQKAKAKLKLPIALGQKVSGEAVVDDLTKMPHLLIAGATGSGKSVCINSIITCLLLHLKPDTLHFVLIDPKRVELSLFNRVPHLLSPVVVEVGKVVSTLKWMTHEMDRRYKQFEMIQARHIDDYNRKVAGRAGWERMPYIVVLIDELADLMMTAPEEIERTICRLAQLARATGIHLVVATQRPSVDVVTGLIKANFPTRISFAVTSQIDSRVILDIAGAEKLLGRGDMLYLPTDAAKPTRVQGSYVSDEEIQSVVQYWRRQGDPQYSAELLSLPAWEPGSAGDEIPEDLYRKAVDLTERHNHISASFLQRGLRIGYRRAARLMERLREEGYIDEKGDVLKEQLHIEATEAQEQAPH